MANNIPITAGSGTVVATEQAAGGEHISLQKLSVSVATDRTLIPATAANGLTVDVTRVQGTVSVASTSALGTAANVSGTSSTNVLMTTRPGNWTISAAPGANTQATATKAAGAAGVRHVCTGFQATIAAGSVAPTVPVTPVLVVLRDGATGAGTILWQTYVSVPATAGTMASVHVTGINVFGTTATAMTIEFNAAGGAGTFESVSLAGYDAS
jgi:hypothetical protein